jgi:hypothetical protein
MPTTLIVTSKPSYNRYANAVADKFAGVIAIASPAGAQEYWSFVKEQSALFGADQIILIGKSNLQNKTYQLRNTHDITHHELCSF